MKYSGLSLSFNEYSPDSQNMPNTPITSSSNISMTEPLQLCPPPRKGYDIPIQQQQSQQQLQQQQQQASPQQGGESAQYVVTREKLIRAFRLNRKKQLTIERINKYNMKLMEELKTPRVKASNCALMVIDYTEQHTDPLIPEIWGPPVKNPFNQKSTNHHQLISTSGRAGARGNQQNGNDSSSDGSGGCCTIM